MAQMASVQISVQDRYKLAYRMGKAPEKVAKALNKGLLNVAIDFEREAKKQVPVITARLQNSIETERQALRYEIAPHTVYAEWVHEGSKGLHIPAKLRSSSYKGNPFMDRAFDIVEPGAKMELNKVVKDIIESI